MAMSNEDFAKEAEAIHEAIEELEKDWAEGRISYAEFERRKRLIQSRIDVLNLDTETLRTH